MRRLTHQIDGNEVTLSKTLPKFEDEDPALVEAGDVEEGEEKDYKENEDEVEDQAQEELKTETTNPVENPVENVEENQGENNVNEAAV